MSDIIGRSSSWLAARIAAGELSSVEVVKTFIDRIEVVNRHINAVVTPLFDDALAAAKRADQAVAKAEKLGPLHGVPITVKESFFVAGTPSTMGLSSLNFLRDTDSVLVQRLRNAGAIIVAKTNVPQLMLFHETDNPLYGCTNNPWHLSRSPGGSTGGEAAIIAAGGSPLGLGGDLGGSIRMPAHFCGIHGLKPTSHRLPRKGSVENLRGLETMVYQPGPMARHVDDLCSALDILVAGSPAQATADAVPAQSLPRVESDVQGLRVACWQDDGYFPPSPAIRRLVAQAAQALEQGGAVVESRRPPDIDEAMQIYYATVGADGAADARRLLHGNLVDKRLKKLLRVARIPRALRWFIARWYRFSGQRFLADLLESARASSADEFLQIVYRHVKLVQRWEEWFQDFDVVLTPPHALVAMPHGAAIDMIPAASYSFLPNLLGVPAGVVSLSRVAVGEESDRVASRDRVVRGAIQCEDDSAGMPVGVQVFAKPWHEHVVLGVMKYLESVFLDRDDFPCRPGNIPTPGGK